MHENKSYAYSLIIKYHASKCAIPHIATIGEDSTDGVKKYKYYKLERKEGRERRREGKRKLLIFF